MQGCCQQLPPAQEQWKTPAKFWSLGVLPLPHNTGPRSLCVALLLKHSCLLSWDPPPSRAGWGAIPSCLSGTPWRVPQLTSLLGHPILAGTGEGGEQQSVVQLKSTLHHFQGTSSHYAHVVDTLRFTSFEHLLQQQSFSGNICRGFATCPSAHCRCGCTPTSHASGHSPASPAEDLFRKVWLEHCCGRLPCPAHPTLTHTRPVRSQQRAIGLLFWWVGG